MPKQSSHLEEKYGEYPRIHRAIIQKLGKRNGLFKSKLSTSRYIYIYTHLFSAVPHRASLSNYTCGQEKRHPIKGVQEVESHSPEQC